MTRECHGDLRLEHVYLLPDGRLVIVDCLEFSQALRCIDPVADVAFLVMGLKFHGRADLARRFADAYVRESGDEEGRRLLPLYTAYRAVVRAKVEGLKQEEDEIPEPERRAAAALARAYWLLALGELELPERRPCLVMVGGLPGVGKSTLAGQLARRAGFSVVRSDVVRKELAGPDGAEAEFEHGHYSPAWTKRTYAECLRRAEDMLRRGERVIVDASFREEARRRMFLDVGERMAVPAVLLDCQANPKTVRARLSARQGDASDAGWEVYREMASRWEPPGPRTREQTRPINTDGDTAQALAPALSVLRERGLAVPEGG
jgi:predicted kinase